MIGCLSIYHSEQSFVYQIFLSPITVFKCGLCISELNAFQTANELNNHMKQYHCKRKNIISEQNVPADESAQYECHICKIKLLGWRQAKSHLKQHTVARNQKCPVCDEMCTANELNRHVCGSDRCIQCEYCKKSFDAILNLIQHIETDHTTDKIHHRCGKCTRFFGMMRLKDIHEMQHKEEPKLFTCDVCAKGFSQHDKFVAHVNRHSDKSACSRFSFIAITIDRN